MHRSLIVCDVEYVVKSVKLMPSPIVYLFLVLVCSQSHWEKCIKCTSIYLFDIFKLHADERYPYPYHNDFYQTSHFSVPFMSSIYFISFTVHTHVCNLHQTLDARYLFQNESLPSTSFRSFCWHLWLAFWNDVIIVSATHPIAFATRIIYHVRDGISFGILVRNANLFSLLFFSTLWPLFVIVANRIPITRKLTRKIRKKRRVKNRLAKWFFVLVVHFW